MMDGSDDSEIRKINDGSPPERHPARVILFSLSRKKKKKKLEEKDLNVRPFFFWDSKNVKFFFGFFNESVKCAVFRKSKKREKKK